MEPRSIRSGAERALTLTVPPGTLDLVPADARRGWAAALEDGVTAARAIDAAIRDVSHAVIGVIGQDADAIVEWLRDRGKNATVFTLPHRKERRERGTARARRQPDVIVAANWIEHEPQPGELLRTMRTLLGPEGRLVVVVPNLTHASVRVAMLLGHHPVVATRSKPGSHLFTVAGLERLLNETGFTVTSVERQIDSQDTLKEIGTSVPAQVLEMLAGDADALTSHYALVAQPEGSAAVAVLHRRLRELTETQRAAARIAERLDDRVAELEVRVRHWAAETDALAAPGVPSVQALAALDARIEQLGARLDEQLGTVAAGLSAATTSDARRDAAFRDLAQGLAAHRAEMDALIRRIEKSRYRRLIPRIRAVISRETRRGAVVAVLSRGDESLVTFDGRKGWHFPQTEGGVYAGHYPADSDAAIAHLEELRARGARYLLVPRTAFWWFHHYQAFHDHLARRYSCVFTDERTCALFALRGGTGSR